MTPYRAGTIKRDRRTKDRIELLDNAIRSELKADHPQSVRHAFYRMTDPRLPEPIEKSERGYRHVQDRIVKLRRSGTIPYGWIVDATRRGYHTQTWGDAAEFLRASHGWYRGNLWKDAGRYCEVWTESRSIAGVIEKDCREMAVSLNPAGGFTSITLAYEAAREINNRHAGQPVHIFYIGDYDPAGVLIDVALERELRTHLNADVDLQFERIAVTAEQIKKYDLPRKPRKETDRRAQHVDCAVEAEALPAAKLRRMLRVRVEALLPEHALTIAKVAEDDERANINLAATLLEDVLREGDSEEGGNEDD
jgi:hypothetical protein